MNIAIQIHSVVSFEIKGYFILYIKILFVQLSIILSIQFDLCFIIDIFTIAKVEFHFSINKYCKNIYFD